MSIVWKYTAEQGAAIKAGDKAARDKFFEDNHDLIIAYSRAYTRRHRDFTWFICEAEDLQNQLYSDMDYIDFKNHISITVTVRRIFYYTAYGGVKNPAAQQTKRRGTYAALLVDRPLSVKARDGETKKTDNSFLDLLIKSPSAEEDYITEQESKARNEREKAYEEYFTKVLTERQAELLGKVFFSGRKWVDICEDMGITPYNVTIYDQAINRIKRQAHEFWEFIGDIGFEHLERYESLTEQAQREAELYFGKIAEKSRRERERIKADPEKAERVRAKRREYKRRKAQDPEYMAKKKAYNREYSARRRAKQAEAKVIS